MPSIMTRRSFSSLLLAAPAFTAPAKHGMDPARLRLIPERMKSFVDRSQVPGVVTLVQRRGEVAALDAVGWRDIENKKPMQADTLFQIASMTKPVTGVAVALLAEEGKLAFSDPVEKHLPEFRGLWVASKSGQHSRTLVKPSRVITIRDLMTHTSGMSGEYPAGLSDVREKGNRTLAEVVLIASQQPLEFQPGTQYLYSNTGIDTLGRIVEVLADQPFDKFTASRIFEPLGMKDTFFYPTPDKLDRIAVIYEQKDGKLTPAAIDRERRNYRYTRASGGLFSTARDMAAFHQMNLNGGTLNGKRVLSKSVVEVMTQVHTGSIAPRGNADVGWGLTWQVVRGPGGTLTGQSIGSYGHGGAYGTGGWIDPKKELVGVFMIQRQGGGATEVNTFMELAAGAVES
ncbi:MAG: beta-lactamase family protein [Acidobacteria bacterium]|nr:beta-lactamase family protein [Acidobacteriota bacterium]